MANLNAPYGFVPMNGTQGEPATSTFTIASGYATAIGYGDPVAFSGTGTGNLAGIVIGVAGSAIVGVLVGVNYTDANGQPQWAKNWTALTTGTNIEARVITDPMVEYRAQVVGGSPAVTDYGSDMGFVLGTPSLGMSTSYLDGATIGSGTDFQIRRAYESPLNSVAANMQVVGVFRLSSYNYPYTVV